MTKNITSTKAGTVFDIDVSVGDTVSFDQKLLEIETKKGNVAVLSPYQGVIESVAVSEGDKVDVDAILLQICVTETPADQEIFDSAVEEIDSELTIIGGGPGGYVAAIKAAKMGLKVILIEKESLGGTCLNWGCIPTKALVRSAEMFESVKNIEPFGLTVDSVSLDLKRVIRRKNEIVGRLVGGIQYLIEQNRIRLISGDAKFIDQKSVSVNDSKKNYHIKSQHIIIATGSETTRLAIPGVDLEGVLDSRQLLDLDVLPDKLAIIGGGVIGMEFAFIYAAFGAKVTVIEYLPEILPSLDDDVIREIKSASQKMGISILTHSEVKKISQTDNQQLCVHFNNQGSNRELMVDKVLMAVGRRPYTKGLDLENAGIKDTQKGIKVNAMMQTDVEDIYAIGDVTNIIQLAHVASHQGIIAVENIAGNQNHLMNYDAVPCAIFTHPEIASVGLTEKGAAQQNLSVTVGKFPYAANGKALAMGDDQGFIKVIADKASKKVLGATIVGLNAADLIATLTVSVQNGLTTEQLAKTIFAHPTTAEVIHESVLATEGGALHFID